MDVLSNFLRQKKHVVFVDMQSSNGTVFVRLYIYKPYNDAFTLGHDRCTLIPTDSNVVVVVGHFVIHSGRNTTGRLSSGYFSSRIVVGLNNRTSLGVKAQAVRTIATDNAIVSRIDQSPRGSGIVLSNLVKVRSGSRLKASQFGNTSIGAITAARCSLISMYLRY